MVELATAEILALGLAALLIGISKTALPGAGTLSVAIFATVLPARQSTAAILLLLLVGDVIAVWTYRRDADFAALRRLIPTVLVGMVVGATFLYFADDTIMRRAIGAILLALTLLTLLLMQRGVLSDHTTLTSPKVRGVYGTLGGFTTMAANAGGPVMTLYFLAARFDVVRLVATQAWFFFTVNVLKLPFSLGIGLLNVKVLPILAALAPVVIIGGLIGRRWIVRMNQTWFNRVIVVLTILSCLYLLR
ncbi:MAG TPA: sulfite exporter TauE/SafE family protein [Actinomycetales bacterium]|nr:sulfite exporter TauE/SafE family protein [Actinomycetales bacterium]